MSDSFFEEFREEAADFFEDFWEHLSKRGPKKNIVKRKIVVDGIMTTVRPAYLFAERIDNLLKIIFGLSITISALTATFLGFTSLSDLLGILIFSIPGRLLMFTIGLSYFTIALWKLMHISTKR